MQGLTQVEGDADLGRYARTQRLGISSVLVRNLYAET